jgi:hypothetical protein
MLMAVASLTFILASVVHFGTTIPLGVVTLDDPFRDAAIPEAIIAVVMAVGMVALLAGVWWLALVATLFSTLGTILGLSIVLSSASGRSGDIAYHVSVLAVLVVTIGLLVTPRARVHT